MPLILQEAYDLWAIMTEGGNPRLSCIVDLGADFAEQLHA
jgi:hypothetical protein